MTENKQHLQKIIKQTEEFVRENFKDDTTGHDYEHLRRVVLNVKLICKEEQISSEESDFCELCAWLHDLGDYKLNDGVDKSKEMIESFLSTLTNDKTLIQKVIAVVAEISFSKGKKPSTITAKIVQDADRLDAIGAIGIARCFAYGGSKNRAIYNSQDIHQVETSYQHFFDKLFKLKQLMNTTSAKEMAEDRHIFMERFIEQFNREVNL